MPHANSSARPLYGQHAETLVQLYHRAADALVPHQQVGSVAYDGHRDAVPFANLQRCRYLLRALDRRKNVGRTAYPEGRMLLHGFAAHDPRFTHALDKVTVCLLYPHVIILTPLYK